MFQLGTKTIAKREQRIVVLIAGCIILVSAIPYLIGYFNTPLGKEYLGFIQPYREDAYYHFSYLRQAEVGYWLFEDLFNGGLSQGHIVPNILFVVLGKLAWLLGGNIYAAFYLYAAFFIVVNTWLIYLFISEFLDRYRFTALALTLLGGGLGWYWPGSRDWNFIEFLVLRWMRMEVVIPATVALILIFYLAMCRAQKGGQDGCGRIMMAIAAGLQSFVHPHDLLPMFLVGGAWLVITNQGLQRMWFIIWPSMVAVTPAAIWYGIILNRAPHLTDYVSLWDGYHLLPQFSAAAPFWLVIVAGAVVLWRVRSEQTLLWLWLLVTISLLFIRVPLGGQHYLMHAHTLPLSILAVTVLSSISLPTARIGLLIVTVCFASLSNAGSYIKDIRQMSDPEFGGYVEPGLKELVHEIGQRCDSDDVLLASPSIGGPVILEHACRLWMLQEEQTVEFFDRQRDLQALAAGDPQVTKRLLAQANIVALAKNKSHVNGVVYTTKARLELKVQGWSSVYDNEVGTVFIRDHNFIPSP